MSNIDLDKIEKSDAPEEVTEVYKLLKGYIEDTERIKWIEDVYKRGWEVAWGDSDSLWSQDEKDAMTKKGQIPIAINDIAKGIQGASAVSTANKPGINVKPIGSSDLYISELVKRGFDFVWQQNQGQQLIFDVVKESKTGSLGVIDIKFDEAKGKFGKICLDSDNPLDYYFDKKSRRADKIDSPIIKAHLVTIDYAKDNYDVTDDDLDFKPIPEDETPGKSKEGNISDGYVDASKSQDTGVNDKEEEEQVWEIEAWLLKTIKEYGVLAVNPQTTKVEKIIYKTKKEANNAIESLTLAGIEGKLKEYKSEKRVLRVIVGKKLISEEENPYGLDSDGDPVMPKIFVPHDRSYSGFYTSPTYRSIEISRSRNKRRMQTIYVVSKNIDAPIVAAQGYQWKADDVHGDTLIVPKDSPFPPHRLLPGTTSSELMAMEQRDEVALNDEYDMNDVMKGKLPPGVDSGKLVIALQDQAGMMSTPFIGMLEGVIEKTAKVIFSLMLRHWPREMWERLIDDEEKTSWQPDKQKKIDPQTGDVVKPDPNDISLKWLKALDMVKPEDPNVKPQIDLEGLDIRMVAGSTTPTNRMAKRMDAMEMVKAGIYPPEIALEYVDDPNKDKAIAIIKNQQQMLQQQNMMKGTTK
jgi:hypothetical protein